MTVNNVERKGFISAYSSQIILHCWRTSGQDSHRAGTEAGADTEAMMRLLSGLLLMSFSACFILALRTTISGVTPPMHSELNPLILIKKVYHRLAHKPINWVGGIFSIEISQCSKMALAWVKLA
jgi:hypothetical protein